MTESGDPQTIFALATAPGRAGVAVVRLSGPQASIAAEALSQKPLPKPRMAARAQFVEPKTKEQLDDGLLLWFPGPRSFTGEDVVELHLHGGRAVVAGVLEALSTLPGLRPAEAGEFSQRAFRNDKMDLTAAEGLADLIDAETSAQRRQALRQMGGALAQLCETWRAELVRAMAHWEAAIDFPDEEIPEDLDQAARARVATLAQDMRDHLEDGRRGERLRDGLHVAIIGPPNAGKSSLLNALAGREAAIVSATPGATRDVIEVHLDLGGYPVIIADTAGLREAVDDVEAEGVRRAQARAQEADLTIALFDGEVWPLLDESTIQAAPEDALYVLNKQDRTVVPTGGAGLVICGRAAMALSVKSGQGMDAFLARLEAETEKRLDGKADAVFTRARHRAALGASAEALMRALEAPLPELAAEDLRLAARALGRITGRVDVEELLDIVFSDFCIGK